MRVELHDGLMNAQNLPATRIVVYDDFDNPIALVVKVDNGQYVAATATQKQFTGLLKALGINKTLIVEHLDATQLKPLE